MNAAELELILAETDKETEKTNEIVDKLKKTELGWLVGNRHNAILDGDRERVTRAYAEKPVEEGGLGVISYGIATSSTAVAKAVEVATQSVRAQPIDPRR